MSSVSNKRDHFGANELIDFVPRLNLKLLPHKLNILAGGSGGGGEIN